MPQAQNGGRPSKYDPAYCEQVIDFGDRGHSLFAFAGSIGVARSTINEWMGKHPEFAEAVEIHKARRALIWEERLGAVASAGGAQGQATAIIFGLKNVAPDEFRDRHEHEVAGAGGGPIQVIISSDDAALN